MKRYPHTLKRDGLYASGWTLKGPVITGRFTTPSRKGPGQYHSPTLRIRYEPLPERRVVLRFQTPRLARGGHRLMGEARLGGTERGVEVRSTVADEPPLHVGVHKAGLLRRHLRLVGRDGTILAVLKRDDDRFDVDLNAEACRWFGAAGDPVEERRRRLVESALAMYLAALVESVRRDEEPAPPPAPAARESVAVVTRLLRRRPAAGSTGSADAEGRGGRHGRAS